MAAEARAVRPGKGHGVVALRQARRGDGRPALRFRLGRPARHRCRCWLSCCQGSWPARRCGGFDAQQLRANARAVAQDHRAFDRVLEFADVAGPIMLGKRDDSLRCEALDGDAVAADETLGERLGKQLYIAFTIAQRRNVYGHNVEAKV